MTLLLPVGEVYKIFAFCGALYYGGLAFDLIGCPALVGEIVVGMLLGPDVANIFSSELVVALMVAGQAGLCLMVLEGGICMDAAVLREKGVRAVVLAATGTVLPVILGWATMLAMGHESMTALASGIALSSTAIGFTMRMMTDMNLLDTAEGQLITAAAMIDDVFSLILLAMLTVVQDDALTSSANSSVANAPAVADVDAAARAWTVCRPLLASGVVTILGFGAFRIVHSSSGAVGRAVDRASPRVRATLLARQDETMLLILLGGGTLAAWLSEGLFSTLLLGAFTVGAIFCTQPLARAAWLHVAPIQAWAARCFFGASVGFAVPVRDLLDGANFAPGLLLTVAAILGKWLSGAWGTSLYHNGTCGGKVYWGTFMRVGCAMIGRGELGFQLATSARASGILTPEAYSATIWALLLATLLGPYAFKLSMRFTPCGLEPGAGKPKAKEDYQPPNVVPFSARRPPFGHRAPQAESGNKSVPLWLTAHRRTAMLAADKLLLRSTVKQRAIQLREKELSLFNDNFNAVGTQSAVLAGFAMTSFAEIDLPHNAFYAQKACLHLCVTISICANLMCTASTTFVSVWGSGKALRGKDGSMDEAVDGMHNERAFIFGCFGVGLITTLLALMSASWILMTLEVAMVATLGISWCIFVIVRQARRIHAKFGLSKDENITFNDILQSPAAGEMSSLVHHEQRLDDVDDTAVLIPTERYLAAQVRRGAYDV